ncbi:translation initiation factor IF-2 [Candidatus Woesearchaeota archaeon]|nr:translation initiation factor IF-2 [Candidatus Woesearchaeota archaeon]
MATRKVLLTVVGHVDHGKTSLLDKIRQTAVTKGEAGGITQAVGVSIIPMTTIQKICGSLLDAFKGNLTVPGLLAIDTPGHAAFTSLRKRGGSLADIAILIVDINEGFKPQTIESIEILKANKVPFIIAANKVDLIHGWQYDKSKLLMQNINSMNTQMQGEFEKKLYELVGTVAEHDLQSERFDRVEDYTKQIAIVPVSAHTGQGIPELLMVLTGLAQKFLEKKLEIEETGNCKGTILEVKEEKGMGTTLDAIIYNGQLKVNDTLVIGGIDQSIVVKVRALLEPAELSEMREKKSSFKNVKQVTAATGVKISAPGLNEAISGMPIRSCSGKDNDEIEKLKQEVQEEVGEIIVDCDECLGVIIKADTIGGLEALRNLLQGKNIPVSNASIGNVTKKDLSKLESLKEKDEFKAVILGFTIKVPEDLTEQVNGKKLKIITNNVIYKIIEDYEKYLETLKKDIEMRKLSKLVRPCKFAVLKGYTFRQSNPAIMGVEIEIGQIKTGDPIMNKEGKQITTAKSMREGKENISLAQQGKQLAMSMDGVTVGRQVDEGDFLYTDIPEEDFRKLKEMKKHLSKMEIEVLKEVAEIKRKNNPVWGIG